MRNILDSVRAKIALASAVFVAIALTLGAFGAVTISRLNSNVGDEYSQNLVPILDLANVRGALAHMDTAFHIAIARRDTPIAQDLVAQTSKYIEQMNSAWADYYPADVSDASEKKVAEEIRDALKQFQMEANTVASLLQNGKFDDAMSALNRLDHSNEQLLALLKSDIIINAGQAKGYVEDSQKQASTALVVQVGLIGAAMAVAVGVFVFLVRAITRPLNFALAIASAISEGKLENRVDTDARGEFGALMHALSVMDAQLATTVRRIQATASSVSTAAAEIASGNMNLSSRTEEQAAALEETASNMTQVTVAARQNADNARQANGLASEATERTEAGHKAVRAMVDTMDRISTGSLRIAEITGVIEGIAFQTNILALNAAVEAARAGDSGRGFAVVASEVRALAQRSAGAAKEIKELISSSVGMVEDGARQAEEASETMEQVDRAVRRVNDIVSEIAAASDEQSRGIEQVCTAISQMDEVTQQNAALVEQSAAAAQSLNEHSSELRRSVCAFTIAGIASIESESLERVTARNLAKTPVSQQQPARTHVASANMARKTATGASGADWQTF